METNNLTAPIAVEKDRNTLTIELMNRMKLHGMAAAFTESLTSTMAETMTIDSFLHMLLAREWDYRANAAIQRLIRGAAFRYKACLEQIDYAIPRGLDRNQMERLASLEFIRKGQNLFITGSSGTGKSFLATAMGYEACKKGIRTYYANAPKLMGTLKVAKVKGTLESELKRIERSTLLILDDLFLVNLDAKERPILLDIIEDRHGRKSIIITSQLPTDNWYDAIGDPTVADAIMDRIIHTAHRIELTGESVRKMAAYSCHVKYTVSSVKKPSAMGSIQRSLWGREKGLASIVKATGIFMSAPPFSFAVFGSKARIDKPIAGDTGGRTPERTWECPRRHR